MPCPANRKVAQRQAGSLLSTGSQPDAVPHDVAINLQKKKGLVVLQHHQADGQGKLVSNMTKAIVTSAAFFALALMVEPICAFIDSLPPLLNMALVFVMVGAIMFAFWLMMRRELELCEGHYER